MKKEFDWILKEKYGGKFDRRILADMRRVWKGEPIDYVVGFSDFLGCKINLLYRPLIPRAETEFWTEKAITQINADKTQTNADNPRESALRVLDLFAGSGCIGIAILKHIKNSRVDFGELNKKFLKQIRKNLRLNKISLRRARLIRTNTFGNIKRRYDYIFANPPYVAETRKNKVQPEVLKYEPHKSLFGGKDGLFYIKKLIIGSKKYLKENGKIYIEFSSEQKSKIKKLARENKWRRYQFFKDQYKRWRYLWLSI